jgi:hypothetical protein
MASVKNQSRRLPLCLDVEFDLADSRNILLCLMDEVSQGLRLIGGR